MPILRLFALCLITVAMAGCDGAMPPEVARPVKVGGDGALDGWVPAGRIPAEFHQQNTGGSDGLGLCVPASCVAVLRTMGYPEEAEQLWAYVKRRPGGSYPEKWKRTAADAIPDVPYVSVVGNNWEMLEALSAAGIPFAGTMGHDPDIYGAGDVPHYCSWEHFDKTMAVYVDNNKIKTWTFVPRAEAERRFKAGTNGQGWFIAFPPKE